jgi:hypothetical protein
MWTRLNYCYYFYFALSYIKYILNSIVFQNSLNLFFQILISMYHHQYVKAHRSKRQLKGCFFYLQCYNHYLIPFEKRKKENYFMMDVFLFTNKHKC